MKTVLILTHSFPPINTISVCRYLSMARYLPEFGWNVIVVTPDWTIEDRTQLEKSIGAIPTSENSVFAAWDPNFHPDKEMRVERVAFRSRGDVGENTLKKVWSKCTAHYYDYLLGNLPDSMMARVKEICENENVSAIFSSGNPEYLFRVASICSAECKIPWIADYRDLVDQNPIKAKTWKSHLRQNLSRKIFVYRNNFLVKTASYRVIVTQGLVGMLEARNDIPVKVIMNGYDPQDFPDKGSSAKRLDGKFTISYGGTIYPYQQPELFFDGLLLFIENNPKARDKVKVRFFGQSCDQIRDIVPPQLTKDIVHLEGNVSRPVFLNILCGSDVLLYLSVHSKWIPAKLFEYLAANRRIMSVPGDGDITDRILHACNTGITGNTAEKIAKILEESFSEWQENGSVYVDPVENEISRYSRKSQAQKLADLLHIAAAN